MFEPFISNYVPTVVRAIELLGVTIIAAGAVVTLAVFFLDLRRRDTVEDAIGRFRSQLGRSILLGLEFLVAADIIHTILVELTLDSVLALGGIVLIRTILSFSLEAEIEGQWPWQRAARKRKD